MIRITDFRTHVSGILPHHLKSQGIPLKQVVCFLVERIREVSIGTHTIQLKFNSISFFDLHVLYSIFLCGKIIVSR